MRNPAIPTPPIFDTRHCPRARPIQVAEATDHLGLERRSVTLPCLAHGIHRRLVDVVYGDGPWDPSETDVGDGPWEPRRLGDLWTGGGRLAWELGDLWTGGERLAWGPMDGWSTVGLGTYGRVVGRPLVTLRSPTPVGTLGTVGPWDLVHPGTFGACA